MPSGHRAIGLKWVFKLKRNEEGEVGKHKARLVAKGYDKNHGVPNWPIAKKIQKMSWRLKKYVNNKIRTYTWRAQLISNLS